MQAEPDSAKPPTSDAPGAGSDSADRPLKWERRKDYRPGELLDAALEMFAERGYAATRLDDVARAAGVSKGTLYLYYPSKEDLFKAVVRSAILDWLSGFQRKAQDDTLDSTSLLNNFFAEFWHRLVATRLSAIMKLVVAEASNFPEVAKFFHQEVVTPIMQLLVRLIQRGVERREFRDVDAEMCAHLWISLPVLKAIWMHSFDPICVSAAPVPFERLVKAHITMIFDALRPLDGPPLLIDPI